jgi:hypothetical protein
MPEWETDVLLNELALDELAQQGVDLDGYDDLEPHEKRFSIQGEEVID